jgi:hypothetical protein
MGRRGPQPRPTAEKRERPTGVRLKAELRDQLQRAADDGGVTLSREIERRLARSFEETQKMYDLFYGQKTFWLFQRIAGVVGNLEFQTKKRWWEDRFTFDLVADAITAALEVVKPKGRPIVPSHMRNLPSPFNRERPRELGRSAMLISLFALEDIVDQSKHPGYSVSTTEADDAASAYLTSVYSNDPLKLYAKDRAKRLKSKRGKTK